MSKQKPLYVLRTQIDANPLPTDKLKQEWAFLDKASFALFNKKYDNLSAKQRSKLHTAIMDGDDPNHAQVVEA